MRVWNKIKWIFKIYIELRKKSYPLVNYGVKVLLGVPVMLGGMAISLVAKRSEPFLLFDQFEITVSDISDISQWMAIIFAIVGIGLIYYGIKTVQNHARKTAKVLIVSMLGRSAHFPDNVLYESEKVDARETIELGLQEESDYVTKSIEMFNAEKMVDIYHRFILHHDCKKIFLGGRARVPFLVAYGSCFRNISANIVYYDQMHQDMKWHLLDDEDKQVTLTYNNTDSIQPNTDGEIGIAFGLTTPIEAHQLPNNIQNNTLFISPNTPSIRNLIKNQDNLERISAEIKTIIDRLSSKENCRTIHLFLSVQVSMALELGRNYQEGTHKDWVIHNFDPSEEEGQYTWAIKFMSNGTIEQF